MKCRLCGSRRHRIVKRGPLRPDPKHPDDRHYDEQDVTLRCCHCGSKRTTVECPNLLADLFSLPKKS